MSVKYTSLMLSAGLTAVVFMSTSVNAGFEWTPPEKKEILAPIVNVEPEEPILSAPEILEAQELPQIQAEVMEGAAEIEEVVLSAPEPLDMQELPSMQTEIIEVKSEPEPALSTPELLEPQGRSPIQVKVMDPVMDDDSMLSNQELSQIPVKVKDMVMESDKKVLLDTTEIDESIYESIEVVKSVETDISEEPPFLEESVLQTKEERQSPLNNMDTIKKMSEKQDNFKIEPFPTEVTRKSGVVVLSEESGEIISLTETSLEEKTIKAVGEARQEKIIWNAPETFDVIEGFGSDMPLALALRQIVPPRYAFSFGKGVNPGARISWDGGQPWNTVLQNSLTPLNYNFQVKGLKVLLMKNIPQKTSKMEVETGNNITRADSQRLAKESLTSNDAPQDVTVIASALSKNKMIDREEAREINIPANEIVEIIEQDETQVAALTQSLEPEVIVMANQNDLDEYSLRHWQSEDREEEQTSDEEKLSSLVMTGEKKKERTADNLIPEIENPNVVILEPLQEVMPLKILETPAIVENEKIEINAPEQQIAEVIAKVDVASVIDTHRTTPSNEIKLWTAKSGQNLKKIIEKWSAQENIHLVWSAPSDYKISKKTIINGTFKNAIDVLLTQGMKNAPKYSIEQTPEYEIRIDVN